MPSRSASSVPRQVRAGSVAISAVTWSRRVGPVGCGVGVDFVRGPVTAGRVRVISMLVIVVVYRGRSVSRPRYRAVAFLTLRAL
jgi:hypothetical protein